MTRTQVVLLGLLGLLASAPYLTLSVVGMLWLWERGWMLAWLAAAAVASLIAAGVYRWFALQGPSLPFWKVQPADNWTAADDRAWEEVQKIAGKAGARPLSLNDANEIRQLFTEVLDAVARQRFPKAQHPYLEVTVPNALGVIELVAHDLRAIAETLPGSHLLTIGRLRRLQKSGDAAIAGLELAYNAYRVARMFYNPVGSLFGEARDVGTRRTLSWARTDFQCRAQAYAVELAGKYAIELYSGRIQLRRAELREYETAASRQDVASARAKERRLLEEKLRVLVLGQVKAGKSSLINALFGEVRAAVGVVPCTRSVEPYLLSHGDDAETIVLDTAGYEDVSAARSLLDDLRQEALRADLILLAVSARSAARAADRAVLEAIDEAFANDPRRHPPPRIAVLTHIDNLRPANEWNPPYDLTSDNPKAQSIRDAIAAVAEDLNLPPESIVPVCLKPGRLYNVQEGLMPLLVQSFPAADRSRVARALATWHDETRWSKLWQQAIHSGRLLIGAVGELYLRGKR